MMRRVSREAAGAGLRPQWSADVDYVLDFFRLVSEKCSGVKGA